MVNITVHEGDCLEIIRALSPQSIDAVVTDPPYCSTSASSSFVVSNARKGMVVEVQFYEAWLREHITEWIRVLKPTGAIWFTCDWQAAMCADQVCARLGARRPAVGIWHRQGLGMGFVLRKTYECFVVIPMRSFQRQLMDEPDVWVHKWTPGNRKNGHSAEKPLDLMERALRLVTASGGTVLDPFMGTGSTGLACVRADRSFIGIEREPEYVAIARERLGAAA